MAVTIQVSFDDGRFGDAMTRLAALGTDQTQLMADVSGTMRTFTMDRIGRTKTGPDGVKWKANKNGTPTLVREGELLRSITASHGKDFAQVGSNKVYAAIHQDGGAIERSYRRGLSFSSAGTFSTNWTINIPARPYLGISAGDAEAISELAGAALIAAITPGGGGSGGAGPRRSA